MLSMSYFKERSDEIALWAERHYVELGDLLKGTEFEVEDLVTVGVLEDYEAIISTDLRTHIPVGKWVSRFSEGQYQTCFLSLADRQDLISLLEDSPQVRDRLRHRQRTEAKDLP